MSLPTLQDQALARTERGQAWIAQFEERDRKTAQLALEALTLVSHSLFERSISGLIEARAKSIAGPVALFATREVDSQRSLFKQAENKDRPERAGELNSVGAGSDLGSEARVAASIRNLCRRDPCRLLNHPSIEQMRQAKVRAIFVVDDIIGSGTRTANFVQSLWREATLKSWHSFGWLQFECLAYTATDIGEKAVRKLTTSPAVHLFQNCPTFDSTPWSGRARDEVKQLFRKYAKRTSKPRMPLGYKDTAVSLIFEHSCPNNTPAVFWAPPSRNSQWTAMFPARAVATAEASAFPPGLALPDSQITLDRVGQSRLAASAALKRRGALGEEIIVLLGLVAKGVRSHGALAPALGLSAAEFAALVERCCRAGLIALPLRMTAQGRAELEHIRRVKEPDRVPLLGEDSYYPTQLRGTRGG